MAVRLTKQWTPAGDVLACLKGNLGVFQLANAKQEVVFIGYAGGKSQFGLKGEVAAALEVHTGIAFVRFEVTTAYHTRYRELLMAHKADHGELPRFNEPITLGRLSPA
ncbi:MAG: DUF7508 domain-containing protein [Pseudomonadales bacterium]